MAKIIGSKQFHEIYSDDGFKKNTNTKDHRVTSVSLQIFSLWKLSQSETDPKELLFYKNTAKKIFNDQFHQETPRGIWHRSLSALNNFSHKRGLQSTDHMLLKLLDKVVVLDERPSVDLSRSEKSKKESHVYAEGDMAGSGEELVFFSEKSKKESHVYAEGDMAGSGEELVFFKDKESFLTAYPVNDPSSYENILPHYSIECLNQIYPFFSTDHWHCIPVKVIAQLNLAPMNKEMFLFMCPSFDVMPTPRAINILKALTTAQLNCIYPYLKTANYWDQLKVTDIAKLNLKSMTQEQFNLMCPQNDRFISLRGKEVLDSLNLKQLNCVYPFFPTSEFWTAVKNSVKNLDLTRIDKSMFDLMCPMLPSGFLSPVSSNILKSLNPEQLNVLYPYFRSEKYWGALSVKDQIAKLDFKNLSKDDYDEIIQAFDPKNLLNELSDDQLMFCKPYIITYGHALLLSLPKRQLLGQAPIMTTFESKDEESDSLKAGSEDERSLG